MIFLRRLILMFSILLLASFTYSQTAKYSNEFLSIGVGARSLSMSNAMVASTNDATSGYWNPAGLCSLQTDFDVSLMHAEYFAGIAKYDYLGGAMALDTSSFLGATIIRFGVDDILSRDMAWHQHLVKSYRISEENAQAYLSAYQKAANTHLGGEGPGRPGRPRIDLVPRPLLRRVGSRRPGGGRSLPETGA